MSKRNKASHDPFDEGAFISRLPARVPHEFVLDALAPLHPRTNPMFGCLAVYLEDHIVLILRDRPKTPEDNGVWIATTIEHHESLRTLFPHMRSVKVFGKAVTDWQVLPADCPDFENAALRACALIEARDPRIGKIPKRKRVKRIMPHHHSHDHEGESRTERGSHRA